MNAAMKSIIRCMSVFTGTQPERCGSFFRILCPAHNNVNSELIISEREDGRVSLRCHRDGTQDYVELDLWLREKDPPSNNRTCNQPENCEKNAATVLCQDHSRSFAGMQLPENEDCHEVILLTRALIKIRDEQLHKFMIRSRQVAEVMNQIADEEKIPYWGDKKISSQKVGHLLRQNGFECDEKLFVGSYGWLITSQKLQDLVRMCGNESDDNSKV